MIAAATALSMEKLLRLVQGAMLWPFHSATISGHAKLRTAEEVESNSYDALERNKTVSNLLLTGSNKHYFVSGKRLISLRGLTEKCSRQFEVVITDRIPFVWENGFQFGDIIQWLFLLQNGF